MENLVGKITGVIVFGVLWYFFNKGKTPHEILLGQSVKAALLFGVFYTIISYIW